MGPPQNPVEAARRARRTELFAEQVDRAIASDEVRKGLAAAPGIDAEYLRTRCALREAELWAEVAEAADAFDEAADKYDQVSAQGAAAAALRSLLTSPSTLRRMALFGLLLCLIAYFWHEPGPGKTTPHIALLCTALGAALLDLFSPLAPLLLRRLSVRRLAGLKSQVEMANQVAGVILPAVAACSFLAAVISVFRAPVVDGIRVGAGIDLPVLIVFGLNTGFIIACLRDSMTWREAGPRPSLGDVVPPLLLTAGALLPLVVALLRNSDGTMAIATAVPNDLFIFGGTVTIASAALLATAGVTTLSVAHVKVRFTRARGRLVAQLSDMVILPLLRTEINNKSQSYEVRIQVSEASGLGELSDPTYKVRTAASKQVAALLAAMPGGSIGLAGARGSGKTTLMESHCGGKRTDTEALAVMVAAPVEYSPREFLLHLYAKVCREVLGPDGETPLGLDPLTRLHRRRQVLLLGLGAFLVAGVGVLLLVSPGLGLSVSTPQLWGVALLLFGFLLVLQLSRSGAGRGRDAPRSLRALAEERLEEIRFQQAFTATWTGSVKAPVGLESALGGGRSLTRQQMHLPEIVDSLRAFLETAARERRVLIGIDELDKMRSERAAEQFLNEIKGVFGVRGCYYLVSVSEDAMVGFERRGMPFRDVFDSTFDEIVWFGPLTPAEAVAALDRRVLGMPVPFKQLCHALAGGLPRDLIRVARAVLDAQDPAAPTDLSVLVTRLVAQDVVRKTRAVAVAAHHIDLEPDVSRFLVVCQRVDGTEIDSTALRRRIAEIPPGEASRLRKDPGSASPLLRLMGELACYCYYSATILEFFDSAAPGSRWRLAGGGDADVVADLGLLAKARQAFALNTRVAWEIVSAFRRAWELPVEPFPVGLEID